jgi:hypothetical protein
MRQLHAPFRSIHPVRSDRQALEKKPKKTIAHT